MKEANRGMRGIPLATRHLPLATRGMRGIVVTVTIILMFAAAAYAQGRWVKLAPIPEPSEELYAVGVNGKMYIFGGNPLEEGGRPGAPRGFVYEYDPASDKWAKKKPMALPAHHIAVAEYRGKVYVFGGGVQREAGGPNQIPINNAWEYDPSADTWKALAPMPTKRMAAVAVEAGGKIYILGGAGNHPNAKNLDASLAANEPHRSLDANEAYDPAANRWETRSPMPTARNHVYAGAVGGKIYVIGGRLGSNFVATSSSTDVVEEYDPATDSWGAVRARMPTPRYGGAWATYGGRIYAAGGQSYTSHSSSTSRALEAYDPANNQWTTLPTVPTARHGIAGAVIGNRLHLVSGHIAAAATGGHALDVPDHDVFEFANK